MYFSWPLFTCQLTKDYNRDQTYQFSRNARNCSLELASGEVEQKRMKNCCFSFSLGTFKFFMYMLTCGLYCLLRFPDTSSAHGMTRRLKTGLPFATTQTGFGPKSFRAVTLQFQDALKSNVLWNPFSPNNSISGYDNCRLFAGIRTTSFVLARYLPL